MDLVTHVKNSILSAYINKSKLTDDVLNMQGMSGSKTRHLYNNMCSLPGARYLEVGTFKGSSFVSAMYENDQCTGFCVDNWSEFGGRDDFFRNTERFIPEASMIVHDKNCWDISKKDVPLPINIFLYDGAHNYKDQKRAITHFKPLFDRRVIIMIDDWACDWVHVKRGTMDGIEEAGLKIVFSHEIGLVNTETYHCPGNTFWGGVV
ncbi:hypothetical protein JKP88DRAFT_177397 [Tribonema minus]|uniref:Class I SAM-dependent methyltransferase n=1 Tax=Tribonema minus TaxID=303371 RepID=A0A836CKP0_9STRA|nr:hypothetical protein JKP88DRAFT_177397 [Tribonema minus]